MRRRVIRTWKFERILAFSFLLCFAVALLAAVFSIKDGAKYITVKGRTLYAVTYDGADSQSRANVLASECFSRGGAGYVLAYGETFYVIAGMYSRQDDAQSVNGSLLSSQPDSVILPVVFDKVRLEKEEQSEKIAAVIEYCVFTLADGLEDMATALGSNSATEAVTYKRLELLLDDTRKMSYSLGELQSEQASACKELLGKIYDILDAAKTGEGGLCAKVRYAAVAAAIDTQTTISSYFS